MNFQPRDLPTHLDTWLTVMREQMNNATSPQLKRLFTAEVEVLEHLIDGFKVGDYKLIDLLADKVTGVLFPGVKGSKVNWNVNDTAKTVRSGELKTQFRGIHVVENEPITSLPPIEWSADFSSAVHNPLIDEAIKSPSFNFATGDKDALNLSAQSRRFAECNYKLLDKRNEQGIYSPSVLDAIKEREINKAAQDFETNAREIISKATKLPAVQVRIIMAQMKDEPLRSVVYECLRHYGLSIAGKGESVEQAAVYYAQYHIERVMKELSE